MTSNFWHFQLNAYIGGMKQDKNKELAVMNKIFAKFAKGDTATVHVIDKRLFRNNFNQKRRRDHSDKSYLIANAGQSRTGLYKLSVTRTL